jgi:type IV pilus assembly protein PilB
MKLFLNHIGVDEELKKGERLSIIHLVDELLLSATKSRASDIHIEPFPEGLRIRFRIDGVLQDVFSFDKTIKSEVISRIKVLAGLATDEHNAPQDGRFRQFFQDHNQFLDIRVSIVPTYHGENTVLRLLEDRADNQTLETLGFGKKECEKIIHAIRKPIGMVLVTGPTGSGKTTTLYTLIKMLKSSDVSIVTIEDPIEYAIPGIEQIPVSNRNGLSFANGLRSILRQDPDIIMVGEIRDPETASIAVNTALTGHLLLSTLHTSNAATTLPRLLDMNIQPYLITSTVNIVIGQRLVRKICEKCKESFKMKGSDNHFATDGKTYYRGKGCNACNGTGYSGRVSINEVLVADDDVRAAILRKASSEDLEKIATKNGMVTMMQDGINKAESGLTTIEEVLRVVYD